MNLRRLLRRVHLYLGCFFAPLLIFFTLSGAVQTMGLHRTPKMPPRDGSAAYDPPRWVKAISGVHQYQRQPVNKDGGIHSRPFYYFVMIMAIGLLILAVLGIYMAFQTAQKTKWLIAVLGAGVLLPMLLLYAA